MVKQISKHLVNIHAMDHAMSLANEFSFKISWRRGDHVAADFKLSNTGKRLPFVVSWDE